MSPMHSSFRLEVTRRTQAADKLANLGGCMAHASTRVAPGWIFGSPKHDFS